MNSLKYIKHLFLIVMVASIFQSCKKDDIEVPVDELEGLQLTQTLSDDQYSIDIYTAAGKFETGYNPIYFQIKNSDGSLVNNATATWKPVMHMTSMSHSCPYSTIAKKANAQSTYEGFIVFQMAGNETEYWELTIDYTIDGNSYSATTQINVGNAPERKVQSFLGSDSSRYVLAFVEPSTPITGLNDMKAVLYRMENMMNFTTVDNYTVKIDPRMPGMGNHGSPNNVDLTQTTDGMYHGTLSLTMTGYWKINLMLLDSSSNIIKGEEVTESNESSSIYFELEF